MSASIHTADDTSFQTVVLQTEGTVLVDFWAPWCAPCRAQAPILERFAADRADVRVVKVNVDESPRIASTYGIQSIPTIAVFRDGKPIVGVAGMQNARGLKSLIEHAEQKATDAA